jgi:hypothetical protein
VLALRLTRGARPAVHLRRLLVAIAAAGTGYLLLSALGHALGHPEHPADSASRLAWCAVPLAATVHLAAAVARTDPGTRPRPGLSALGLGPGRLMAISVLTTALSCTLGSLLALLVFLRLRGDLTGTPVDPAAAQFLAADEPLPLPAALTLLALVPVIASGTVALALRPRDTRPAPRGAVWTYGRFGSHGRARSHEALATQAGFTAHLWGGDARPTAGTRAVGTVPVPQTTVPVPHRGDTAEVPGPGNDAAMPLDGEPEPAHSPADGAPDTGTDRAAAFPDPRRSPAGLPWGIAVLAVGLAVEAYAGQSAAPGTTLPRVLPGVLAGWALAAVGLVLAAPGLTHLCGRLLQAVRPGARRLLAGRALMAEAVRIGRPLGVVCVVVAGAFVMTVLHTGPTVSYGPLTAFGVLLVIGCTVATLLTASVEARQYRADTVAALLRLGAPTTLLRSAAVLRAGALIALFGPLTLAVAELVALPLDG